MRRALSAVALLVLGTSAACAAEAVTPCRIAGIRNDVQCGVVSRALDPANPAGVKIDVHYVVVPAMARRKSADPVFMLAGGPGQSAIALAPAVLPLFTRLNNRRDIVFVDQRGTGRSAPLDCDDPRHLRLAEQADPQRQIARLAQCRDALQKLPYGDLRMFTTPIAMQDLDAVRAALGVERINLVGGSYGTRAALDYQRQFPQRVRRSVIDGVAPPDMGLTTSHSSDAQAVLDKLCKFRRNKGARTSNFHGRSQLCKQIDVGACNSRMQDVSDDCHVQPLDAAFVFANRQTIEQRLRGMLMCPVTGIHDRRVAHPGKVVRRSGSE